MILGAGVAEPQQGSRPPTWIDDFRPAHDAPESPWFHVPEIPYAGTLPQPNGSPGHAPALISPAQ